MEAVALLTVAVQLIVPETNTGLSVPTLNAKADKLASLDNLVTVAVQVLVVVPSPAVTTVVMVLVPTASAILPEAAALTTVVPLTVMAA